MNLRPLGHHDALKTSLLWPDMESHAVYNGSKDGILDMMVFPTHFGQKEIDLSCGIC